MLMSRVTRLVMSPDLTVKSWVESAKGVKVSFVSPSNSSGRSVRYFRPFMLTEALAGMREWYESEPCGSMDASGSMANDTSVVETMSRKRTAPCVRLSVSNVNEMSLTGFIFAGRMFQLERAGEKRTR